MLDEFISVKQRAPFQWVIHEGFDQQHLPIKPRGPPSYQAGQPPRGSSLWISNSSVISATYCPGDS